MKIKAIALIVLSLVFVSPAFADDPYIQVTGSASVRMRPDIASFTITASFTESTAEAARVKASSVVSKAVDIMSWQFGVSGKDIATSYISAGPEYKWKDGENILVGQNVRQSVTFRVRNIDDIGRIYESLMKLDGISISDVTLDKEDKSYEKSQARKLAMQDAYEKASDYAAAANVRLGSIQSIRESGSSSSAYRKASNAVAYAPVADFGYASTEYTADDIIVSSSVEAVYSIR